MLSISLQPNEYVTIGDIVVKLSRLSGDRCYLAIEADRSIPIVRGTVLERNGEGRPQCLLNQQAAKKKHTSAKS